MRGKYMTKLLDFPSNFAAFAEATRLMRLAGDDFIPVYASSNIKVLPYQIAAARFALRSSYLKGSILCDEGSLGKTYEALLIIAQKCYEGYGNILIVLPTNLVKQWLDKIENDFALPFVLWKSREDSRSKQYIKDFFVNAEIDKKYYFDNEKKPERNLYIATYDEAVKDAAEIEKYDWDIVVFDEADFLFKPENKSVITLKKAVGNAFKLLLTPTPITMSIMDIYGLIHFIDESVLPDTKEFYERYFRRPDRYAELSEWVSQFSFRTLKKQVEQYVGFSHRLPLMVYYDLTSEEQKLYDLIAAYLKLDDKQAYPEMDKYKLTLLFYHTVASSSEALASMLEAPLKRSSGEENRLLFEMQIQAFSIRQNSKALSLLDTLKKIFAHLKKQKETQKAVVFVENLATLDMLYKFLVENGFNTLKFKDENALEKFREDKETQILITTDATAKGLDIEYCPVVVQYDLLYNAMEMEQRICRCHRQGQKSDVLVVNLMNKANLADVRIIELINKRTLQFGGIFGMSDEIIGNFDLSVDDVLKFRRRPDIIQNEIEETLQRHRTENELIVERAESSLFTTFSKDISDKIMVTPQYIAEKSTEIRQDLWRVIRHFFKNRHPECFDIDDEKQVVNLKSGMNAPLLFYSDQRAYYSNKKYGMAPDFKPESCRITLTSKVANNIFWEAKCFNEGNIKVNAEIEPCEISFYSVELRTRKVKKILSTWAKKGEFLKTYNILRGETQSGQILSDEECRKILALPVLGCEEKGKEITYYSDCYKSDWAVSAIDDIADEIITRYLAKCQSTVKDDTILIKLKSERQKAKLEDSLSDLRKEIKNLNEKLSCADDLLEELKIKKQITIQERELKKKEAGLFLEQAKIDAETETEIEELLDRKNLFCDFYKMFTIKVCGLNSNQ